MSMAVTLAAQRRERTSLTIWRANTQRNHAAAVRAPTVIRPMTHAAILTVLANEFSSLPETLHAPQPDVLLVVQLEGVVGVVAGLEGPTSRDPFVRSVAADVSVRVALVADGPVFGVLANPLFHALTLALSRGT